ncbi:MAG: polymer-forming cytoskeletal protein [Treponema sp.]|nr:polymer-forming cytoskeletal protein [Treponema sp.]
MAERNDGEKRNLTVFGTETEFDGVLEFRDRLVITGKFNGTIIAPGGDLQIAKKAVCTVDKIDANSIVVSGNIKGNMNAAERVEICSGSVVESDITTARIRIANNVEYSGQVKMLEEEPSVDLFSVASDEFKKAMLVHSDVVK